VVGVAALGAEERLTARGREQKEEEEGEEEEEEEEEVVEEKEEEEEEEKEEEKEGRKGSPSGVCNNSRMYQEQGWLGTWQLGHATGPPLASSGATTPATILHLAQ
jgi:ABC-type Zn2+ transport system substrate-binding protein/surface adhesin